MAGGRAARRAGVVGAGTSGAPSPAEDSGARRSAGCPAGAAAAGFDATGGAAGAGRVSVVLRFPNTDGFLEVFQSPYFFRSLPSSGDSRPPRDFLVSERPVRSCAHWR